MSQSRLNRRSFLKLAASAALAGLVGPLSRLQAATVDKSAQAPNILLLVFDAMTARNMSLYGYPRQNTPNLERFAQRALVYHQHHAAGNYTTPGVASLFTGVYPWTHQALQLGAQTPHVFDDKNIFSLLPEAYHSFAYTHNRYVYILLNQIRRHIDQLMPIQALADYGGMYTENLFPEDYYLADKAEMTLKLQRHTKVPASLWLSLLDFWRTRQANRAVTAALSESYPHGPVACGQNFVWGHCFQLETAIDWTATQAQSGSQPYFGYIHYFPPHQPYTPRAEFAGLFNDHYQAPEKPLYHDGNVADQSYIDQQRRLYDQFIAHVDAEFGRLYTALEDSGALENTCLIVTSDHGEMFERGIVGHGTSAVYEPLLHIPLLMALPGQRERQDIHTPTSAVDLLPTLLHLSGAPLPANLEGAILPAVGTQPLDQARPLYALEAKATPRGGELTQAAACVIQWPYKLISYRNFPALADWFELFDLEHDPDELRNLYTDDNPIAAELKQKLLSR